MKEKKKFDVTQHVLVPKHEKLSDKEKEAFLNKYGIITSDLPVIAITDPAIQHLKPKIDDVIRIIRPSPTAGEIEYYRVVR